MLYRDFLPRVRRLGLPEARPYDLRHMHATYLIAAGVDARTLADRLGHATPAFTLSTYVHAAAVANDLLMKSGRFGR